MNFLNCKAPSQARQYRYPTDKLFSKRPALRQNLPSTNLAVILTLMLLFSAAGFYTTNVLSWQSGLPLKLEPLLEQPNAWLPGTQNEATFLRLKYTGFERIDAWIALFVAFLEPVVNGDFTALNYFGVYAGGQYGALWTLLFLESMRRGHGKSMMGYIGLFSLACQCCSFAAVAPIYLFIHLVASPTAGRFPGTMHSSQHVFPRDLTVLLISITLGYIIPSLTISLPSTSSFSSDTNQLFMLIWYLFPLWTTQLQYTLTHIWSFSTRYFFPNHNAEKQTHMTASIYLASVRRIYIFVITLCIATHLPILYLSFSPSSLIRSLLPRVSYLSPLPSHSPSSIYLPTFPFPTKDLTISFFDWTYTFPDVNFPSVDRSVHTFLQYNLYIGTAACLLWGITLYSNALIEKDLAARSGSLPTHNEHYLRDALAACKKQKEMMERGIMTVLWSKMGMKLLGWTVVGGPACALTVLLWEKDVLVRQKMKQGT